MNSAEKAIKENEEYEVAKKWLQENGTFNTSKIETKDSKSLNSKIIKVTHKVTFLKNNTTEVQINEGEDLKKLVIDMYRFEY